ncbi:MAG: hypothetical protein KAU90_04335, partial [Sulfurovaceae bacterium]|nr:hypothetical protein [Sulfurovaceae bacterium]
LPLLSSFILFSGCSSKDNIAVSKTHLYNNNYGVLPDNRADRIIASETLSEDKPAEIDSSSIETEYSTDDIKSDSDTFLAEDWVPPKPKISYKYMDDPKFYSEDELPKNKFRTANTIIRTPKDTDKSVLYSRK